LRQKKKIEATYLLWKNMRLGHKCVIKRSLGKSEKSEWTFRDIKWINSFFANILVYREQERATCSRSRKYNNSISFLSFLYCCAYVLLPCRGKNDSYSVTRNLLNDKKLYIFTAFNITLGWLHTELACSLHRAYSIKFGLSF